ncbi:MAG: HAMP domain-containing protein [Mailhella sp.]|nr:HAMP domain-containing protein [Mailhella sp.]
MDRTTFFSREGMRLDRLPAFFSRCIRRLYPDSLLSRLILIFSVSFLVFLVLTTIYASESRHFYFMRGLMADRARHMAETAVLLDMTAPEIRFLLRDQFNNSGFNVHFSSARPDFSVADEELEEPSRLMEYMLNRALSRFYDRPLHRGLNRRPSGGSAPDVPRRAVLVLKELNMPSPMEDFWKSLRQYFVKPRRVPGPSVYLASAAIPLHDGSWVVFEDSSPGFPPLPEFPLGIILSIELFFVFVSLFAFYVCVRPLRRLAEAAESFGRDIPGTPALKEEGPAEVREATHAFNRMQESIREFLDERERTIAAVSHDLRTPLTRMRLRVEQLDGEKRSSLLKDIGELQQIMDTTIDIARSKNEAPAMVDVASLLESLVEDRQEMGLDIRLEQDLEDPDRLFAIPPLLARPLSMKRCLSNLMDNALRYGRHVVVGVEDSSAELKVVISDDGPGIAEDQLEKVFEPFYRVEPSRSRSTGGTGLGLSIARGMAHMHGGDVRLENRPEGGLRAIASFCRA